jgi:hypothetical protein
MTSLSKTWLEAALWLWVVCCAVYFLTAPGRIDIVDGGLRFDVTQSMIEVGRPIVRTPELLALRGRDGNRYAFYPLGTSLLALPLVHLGNWLGHGSLEAEQFAFSLTSVPFAAAIAPLLFLIWGRLGVAKSTALRWAFAAAFCTPIWVYAGSSFDTAIQAFWLTLAVWAAVEAIITTSTMSTRWAIVSGFSFAALVNIQEIYAALAVCVFADVRIGIDTVWKRVTNRAVQIIAAGLIVGVSLVLAFNVFKFGNPLDTGRTAVPHPILGPPPIGLLGLFLSPAKSIFLYCPLYVFGLAGLYKLRHSRPAMFTIIGACLIVHVQVVSSLRFWAGEWAWGPRYLIASLPLVCIGFPFAVKPSLKNHLAVAVGTGLVVQLLAISVDHQRYYFERSFLPFFWLDERAMYVDSPLLARPGEALAVFSGKDLDKVRALVPSPHPMSMTSSLYGPLPEMLLKGRGPEWLREYLVFVVPRPWTLWSRYLPPSLRPGRTDLMTIGGFAVALAGVGLLVLRFRQEPTISAFAETQTGG